MLQCNFRRAGLLIIFLCCASFMISSCSSPKGNAADGKKWYVMHKCFACHGKHGNDGGAPKLSGLDMGFDSFVHRLRNTRSTAMPEYSKERISDREAADILAYLKSLGVL